MKKFLKQIITDILMIPVIVEIGYLCTRERNRVVTDDDLSPYAKWVTSLLDTDK